MNSDRARGLVLEAHRRLKEPGLKASDVMQGLMEQLVMNIETAARRERILTLCIQYGRDREPEQLVKDAAMFLAWIDGEKVEEGE